jgi:hypothetical protein
MGDLRNKQRKEAEAARVSAMQAKMDTRHPKLPPPCCRCGLSPQQVTAMWIINGQDRWAVPDYRCPACLPADLRDVVEVPGQA